MLNHVHEGHLTLQRIVDLTLHGPQQIYNIAGKGRMAVGYDADSTLAGLQETELSAMTGSLEIADGRPLTA
jgi:dihydroorotase